MGVVVGTGFVGTAFWNSFRAFHHQRRTRAVFAHVATDFSGRLRFNGVFAFRIIATTIE